MRRLLSLFFIACYATTGIAQKAYTDSLQQKQGKAKVVIYQDDDIRRLVNNIPPTKKQAAAKVANTSPVTGTKEATKSAIKSQTAQKSTSKTTSESSEKAQPKRATTSNTTTKAASNKADSVTPPPAKKEEEKPLPYALAGPRVAMQGYRIQVYSGGNSRQARTTALSVGQKCQSVYPELGVYTAFVSPRWVCYVGDFRTHGEAQVYANRMRASGGFRQATVVRSKVLVPRSSFTVTD